MKLKHSLLLILLIQLVFSNKTIAKPPKLIIGIVVDQMRYDYLERFYNDFEKGGFKKLMKEGSNCNNHHFNYIPTYTAPGHASIFSGTSPRYHGIIANNWYDRENKELIYCVTDKRYKTIGLKKPKISASPFKLKTTSIADQNRLHTQHKGKTIGIALKDRAAILPSGHTANMAYWFSGGKEGNWISSTYYAEKLPKWVVDFNKNWRNEINYQTWDLLRPLSNYTESGEDQNDFEQGFKGKERPTFPYNIKELMPRNKDFSLISKTPFGNTLTANFAIEAIKQEKLGKDEYTDILTVSFSATDYVGHIFGVNSKELHDTYIRLDLDIAKLIKALDKEVGKGNYSLFLTADHGVVHVPNYLKSLKIPSGYADYDEIKEKINLFSKRKFNINNLIESVYNQQVFLDQSKIHSSVYPKETIYNSLRDFLISIPSINKAFTPTDLLYGQGKKAKLHLNGYDQKRSGDLIFSFLPNTIAHKEKGTTHGSGNSYDTHVPLLWYGNGIIKGHKTYHKTEVVDIVPTIGALLNISCPEGNTGKVIHEILKK